MIAMATPTTKPVRMYEADHGPLRLIAEVEGRSSADVLHAALEEYLANHGEALAAVFEDAQRAIAQGDLTALGALAASPAKQRARAAAERNAQL
jgi:hypothetical protein